MSLMLLAGPATAVNVPNVGATTLAEWQSRRRPALPEVFCPHVHGRNRYARIGYPLRPGKHDLTQTDWNHLGNFAEKHWK